MTEHRKQATIGGMQGLRWVLKQRMRFMPLAAAAMLCCLLAGASIHSHAPGWHAMHSCALCTFEDIVAHGATPATSIHAINTWHVIPHISPVRHIAELAQRSTTPIRAPPFIS